MLSVNELLFGTHGEIARAEQGDDTVHLGPLTLACPSPYCDYFAFVCSLVFSAGPESEMQQLQRIFALLGTPSESDWPHVTKLRHYIHFKAQAGRTIRELFHAISDDAADLLSGLLALNPNKRLTATEALAHRYFREKPQPTPLAQLVKIPSEKGKKEAAALAAQQSHEGKPSGRTLSFD